MLTSKADADKSFVFTAVHALKWPWLYVQINDYNSMCFNILNWSDVMWILAPLNLIKNSFWLKQSCKDLWNDVNGKIGKFSLSYWKEIWMQITIFCHFIFKTEKKTVQIYPFNFIVSASQIIERNKASSFLKVLVVFLQKFTLKILLKKEVLISKVAYF